MCGFLQIVDYGDLSYLLESEYEQQLVALSQDAELLSLPIGTRSLSAGKVSGRLCVGLCYQCCQLSTYARQAMKRQLCRYRNTQLSLQVVLCHI